MKKYLVPFEAKEVCWNACLARVEAESVEDAYSEVESVIEEGENPFVEFDCDWDGINTVTTEVEETVEYSIEDDCDTTKMKAYIAPEIFNCWKDYYKYRIKDLLEANDLHGDWVDDIVDIKLFKYEKDREVHFIGNNLRVDFIYLHGNSQVNITQINNVVSRKKVQALSQELNDMLREDNWFVEFIYKELERIYNIQFTKTSNANVGTDTVRELELLLARAKEALRINQLEEMKKIKKRK